MNIESYFNRYIPWGSFISDRSRTWILAQEWESPNTTRVRLVDVKTGEFSYRTATFEKWQEAYKIIEEKEKEFRQEYNDWTRDFPNIKLVELADALGEEMGWKPSDKTVGRIRKAGKMGWLK